MATNSDIARILTFWFDPQYPYMRWFVQSDKLDAEIISNFGPLVTAARTTTTLDNWTQSPNGALALIILLDQFSRNIYRGSAEAFRSDRKALDIAKQAIAQGFDRAVTPMQSAFFYLPLEHDETLDSQNECVSLSEALVARCKPDSLEKEFADKALWSAVTHRNVITKFGRFPARNKALDRQSTQEEIEFLIAHPQGL